MQGGKEQTCSILEDLAVRMTVEVLNICQEPTSSDDSSMARIGIKFDLTTTMPYGLKLSKCTSLVKTSWGSISTVIFLNLRRRIQHIDSG